MHQTPLLNHHLCANTSAALATHESFSKQASVSSTFLLPETHRIFHLVCAYMGVDGTCCDCWLFARRGGTVRVTGVKYNTKQLVVQARLAWTAAIQVHCLDLSISHHSIQASDTTASANTMHQLWVRQHSCMSIDIDQKLGRQYSAKSTVNIQHTLGQTHVCWFIQKMQS